MGKVQQLPLEVPAIKIRNIDAEIRNITYEIIPDKVIVQGTIHKQIFYVGIDNIIHHLSEDLPFSSFVDVSGVLPGMEAQIDINIEKIIAHIVQDGTAIQQKAILEIFVKVEEEDIVNIVFDGTGELVELNQFIADSEKQIIEENELILNQIAQRITEIRAEIRDIETQIIADRVIIQGIIHKQVFYMNENNESVHQAEEIPFGTSIDIQGAEPGMESFIRAEIAFIDYQLENGGSILLQNIIIDIYARVSQIIQERVARGDLLTKIPVVIGENTKQVMRTSQVVLEQPVLKVRRIEAEIRSLNHEIINNKVIVQGIIHKQIFYIGFDDREYQQIEDVSFSIFVDIPGAIPDNDLRFNVAIENIIFEIIGENILEQNIVLELFVKVVEVSQLNIMESDIGLPVILPRVISENNKQILVERQIPIIIPPVEEVVIEFETIVRQEQVFSCQQALIQNVADLECPASKVVGITADVENVEAHLINQTLVAVSGNIVKDITYVCDNIVFHLSEVVPFNVNINLDTPIEEDQLNPDVVIENISFTLLEGGEQVRQLIVIEACIGIDILEFIRVVTSITGPGITTETITVNEEVLISENPLETEPRIFPVVTEVNDPQNLLSVVEKEVLLLNVLNEGLTPVEVVIFAE